MPVMTNSKLDVLRNRYDRYAAIYDEITARIVAHNRGIGPAVTQDDMLDLETASSIIDRLEVQITALTGGSL